jgi:methionyl-tRNA formyltransferase
MASSRSLNIVFAGTPEFAARHLRALTLSHHKLVGVYTQPDRPSGRGKKLSASPVKEVAQAADLPVFQPASLRDEEAQAELKALNPDIMVVVAYGLLLPQAVLDMPRLGCINVHASLLPRWRGAAPIQRAIEADDRTTGITIMQMEAGLDTGPMLHKVACDILPNDTAATLHDRLADMGPEALLQALGAIAEGTVEPEPQDDTQSNYARKIEKAEAAIDWQLSAEALDRRVRAFNPFPIAYTLVGEDRLRIHAADPLIEGVPANAQPGTITKIDSDGIVVRCGEGALRVTRLQLPGKKPMSAAEFVNGFGSYLQPGQQLGSNH